MNESQPETQIITKKNDPKEEEWANLSKEELLKLLKESKEANLSKFIIIHMGKSFRA